MKNPILYVLMSSLLLCNQLTAQTREDVIKKIFNERFESAETDLTSMIAKDPADAYAYFLMADCLSSQEDKATDIDKWLEMLNESEKYCRDGIEKAPNSPLNYAGLGCLLWEKGDGVKAYEYFTKAEEIINTKANKVDKPTRQIAFLKIAETLITAEKKDLDKALTYIQAAQNVNDKNPEVYIILGDYYREKDKIDQSNAIRQYNLALQIDSLYTRAIVRKGHIYLLSENYDEGLKFFNDAIRIDATFAPAYREKAELLKLAQRYNPAIESYAKYLELNNSCRVRQRYASFVFMTKDYKKAVESLNDALPCNEKNAFMYRLLGWSYYETGDYAKGMEYINKFFAMAEANGRPAIIPEDYAYKGKLFLKSGQDSLAIEFLKTALEKNPDFLDGYSEIAAIYFKQKKYTDAIRYYELKAAKASAINHLDQYYLGQAAYYNKEYIKSDTAFAFASAKYPDAVFWRGRCHNKMETNPDNPTGLAKPFHEKFIAYVGNDAKKIETNKKFLTEAIVYLGVYYTKQGNYDCGRAAVNRALELDANNKVANDLMKIPDIQNVQSTTCVLVQ